MNAYEARPNAIAWPPIIVVLAIVLSTLAGFFFAAPFPQGSVYRSAGMLILVVVVALDLWSIMTLRAARTTVMPTRKTTKLVTTGPFRFSRNPLYVGNVLLLFSLALIFANAWFIPAALLSAFCIQKLAIEREEQHLLSVFGAEFETYCREVRRWL